MAEVKIEELNKEEVKTEESKAECAAESSDGYTLEFRSVDNNARRITKNESGKYIWEDVNPLAGKTFVIKPYQRGYRWGTENVRKLLDDIWKYSTQLLGGSGYSGLFADMGTKCADKADKFDFYCLQTLTVKKENGEKEDSERYELIDGQQRLTTLWLIYYMLILFVGSKTDKKPPYNIVYQRNESPDEKKITEKIYDTFSDLKIDECTDEKGYKEAVKDRLDKIKGDIEKGTVGALSIDLVYIENALCTIIDFIVKRFDDTENLQNMLKVIRRNLFFIWYEVNTDDPYTTFTNINSNQIHLTDAELIKSLVLRKDETTSGGDKKTPTDYAKIWEEIEQGLSKDELWAYISNDQTKATRIDLLLTLYASTSENGYDGTGSLFDWYEKHKEGEGKDFAKSVMDSKNGLPSIYYRILEWYDNVDIFHLIGLLTKFRELGLKPFDADKKEQEKLILKIFKKYDDAKCRGQEDFINALKDEVKNCLEGRMKPVDKKKKDGEKYPLIDSVSYEDDKIGVEAVLWTLNVWETMEASENNVGMGDNRRRTPIVNSRFPFSKIAKGAKWQIEHIFPQNPEEEKSYKDLSKDKKEEVGNIYDDMCSQVDNYFDKKSSDGRAHTNHIQNLAMLMASDNASVSNGTLEEKRKKLVEKIGEGSFVPCATVNAFLLYYSQTAKTAKPEAIDYQYWTKLDAECYEARILQCLDSFGI